MTDQQVAVPGERPDLIETLDNRRGVLRFIARSLRDEESGRRSTASELCLGGLMKHVAATESHWIDFILNGPEPVGADGEDVEGAAPDVTDWLAGFRMSQGETLAGLLERYDEVAR